MGNKHSSGSSQNFARTIQSIVSHPGNQKEVKRLFDKIDKDQSGALDKDEWSLFSRSLYDALVSRPTHHVKSEFTEDIGFGVTLSVPAVHTYLIYQDQFAALAAEVKPGDIAAWVTLMFEKADTNKDGQISLEEFQSFLEKDAKQESEERTERLRQLVKEHRGEWGQVGVKETFH